MQPVSTMSASCRRFSVCAEWWGKEMAPDSSFFSQRGVSMNVLRGTLQEEQIISTVSLCTLQIAISKLSAARVVCLTSYQEEPIALQILSQASPLMLKTQTFQPWWLEDLMEFSLSQFPRQWVWENILVHSSVCFFSCPSLWPWFPPFHSSQYLFLPKANSLSDSYFVLFFELWNLFCPSSVQFVGYLGWLDSYLLVFVEQKEPRDLLLCCYLSISNVDSFYKKNPGT